MMFSTKAEYGVRVMVELARRASAQSDGSGVGGDPVVPLAEIAEHDGMPLAYLEHLVARLRKAGLLDSRRGSRGGYMLARPAEEITMAEVVEALEGSIVPIECISQAADGSITCSRESDLSHVCPTKVLWTRVRLSIVRTLLETTLADLLVAPAAGRDALTSDKLSSDQLSGDEHASSFASPSTRNGSARRAGTLDSTAPLPATATGQANGPGRITTTV
jgi:Rrf2 family transcriptional regulator, cysteine metabolism repressor